MSQQQDSLRSRLNYEPVELKFGTSGRRGEVVDLTQLEIYINATAELGYLQSLPIEQGGIREDDEFYFAYDLRPSSTRFVPEEKGRGELCQAIERAIRDSGMRPVNLGQIPTPALMSYAVAGQKGSIMVTGSHIPFSRNGYKLNTSLGELLKVHEAPINAAVAIVREKLYAEPFDDSRFDESGRFKSGSHALALEDGSARAEYADRYRNFFGADALRGKRLLAYQHSAVGRDLLVDVLQGLGSEVIPAGRSDVFVPIDTENIDEEQLTVIQRLVDSTQGHLDAVVSTDGDSDRPLILGVDPQTRKVRFFGGDLVGMIVAEYLKADAVVVPISCNDAIDRGALAAVTEPKTRIGSPFVIAGMQKAQQAGKRVVCGWEANGGFLLGSDIERSGRVLKALPTRDAFLPIFAVLSAATEARLSLHELFAKLPARFSRAALLKKFPRAISSRIVERFSPTDSQVKEAEFQASAVGLKDESCREIAGADGSQLTIIRGQLESLFTPEKGFGRIKKLNYTDGVRLIFANGDVAHFRPSGNADEFRIYAVSDTQARAEEIAQMSIAEPDGILHVLARTAGQPATE